MNASSSTEWAVSGGTISYAPAIAAMEARAAAIATGSQSELVWLLEHPALYTAGVSAKPQDLLDPDRFPVLKTGRGGQYSWHGPGQRIVYLMLDLNRRGRNIRHFVTAIENWLIETLAEYGVCAFRLPDRVGLWVHTKSTNPGNADKIVAIGLKIRKWVSFHGVSINVAPDLTAYDGIVPCGNAPAQFGVTSLQKLGRTPPMSELDTVLHKHFVSHFGPTRPGRPPTLPAPLSETG